MHYVEHDCWNLKTNKQMYTLVLFLIVLLYFSDSLSIMSLWLFWNSLHGQDWPWTQRDPPVLLPKYWDWSWFQKKYVSFSLFSIVLPADLSCTDFTMLRFVPSLSSLFSVWLMKGWSFSNAFMHLLKQCWFFFLVLDSVYMHFYIYHFFYSLHYPCILRINTVLPGHK